MHLAFFFEGLSGQDDQVIINIIFQRFIILQRSALRQAQFGVPWDVQFYRDFDFMDFRLDAAFYRCQKATFQFYNCKLVGPKVPPQPKGGCFLAVLVLWRDKID